MSKTEYALGEQIELFVASKKSATENSFPFNRPLFSSFQTNSATCMETSFPDALNSIASLSPRAYDRSPSHQDELIALSELRGFVVCLRFASDIGGMGRSEKTNSICNSENGDVHIRASPASELFKGGNS